MQAWVDNQKRLDRRCEPKSITAQKSILNGHATATWEMPLLASRSLLHLRLSSLLICHKLPYRSVLYFSHHGEGPVSTRAGALHVQLCCMEYADQFSRCSLS